MQVCDSVCIGLSVVDLDLLTAVPTTLEWFAEDVLGQGFDHLTGHQVRFGTKNLTLLKLLTQENVLVGGFFVISGYVGCSMSHLFLSMCL